MARNKLMAKCQNLEKILSHNDSLELMELNTKSVLDIMQFIHNNQQMDSNSHLYIALRILMTMRVTVAAREKSVSKLKLIKTYLISTTNQEHLTGLLPIAVAVLHRG